MPGQSGQPSQIAGGVKVGINSETECTSGRHTGQNIIRNDINPFANGRLNAFAATLVGRAVLAQEQIWKGVRFAWKLWDPGRFGLKLNRKWPLPKTTTSSTPDECGHGHCWRSVRGQNLFQMLRRRAGWAKLVTCQCVFPVR